MDRSVFESTKKLFFDSINKGDLSKSKQQNRKFCEDVYYFAVYQGYLDAKRTFKGVSKIGDKKEDAFKELAGKIENYFEETFQDDQDYFDQKHNEMCKSLIDSFKKSGYIITYGQAQKIVNMAFKYLYCCEDAEKRKDYFKYCHMALDTYTLNWYNRKTGKNIKEWSKLCEKVYKEIQSNIRENKEYNGTVLENEFIIWPDEMLLEAMENLNEAAKREIVSHKNSIISNEIDKLEQNIEKIKSWFAYNN